MKSAPVAGSGSSWRGLLILMGKLTISAGLITWLLSRLSLSEVQLAMDHPHWGWLALGFLVYGLSALGGAIQWAWILRAAGITAPAREIVRLYFIGLFFNNFLPANIGGDAWKILDLGRHENRRLGVFCATVLDRLLGLTALTLVAVMVLFYVGMVRIPLPNTALLLIPVLLLLTAALALLLSRRLGRLLPGFFRLFKRGKLAEQSVRLTDEFGLYRRKVAWLNGVFAFSCLVQFLRLATHLLVALGLGISLNWSQVLQLYVLIPMLAISLTLPVAINGIGLRESISATLLIWAGLAVSQAVAMEIAAYLVQVVFSLQGGILLWLGRWARGNDDSDPRDRAT